jgi:hypothetical protein
MISAWLSELCGEMLLGIALGGFMKNLIGGLLNVLQPTVPEFHGVVCDPTNLFLVVGNHQQRAVRFQLNEKFFNNTGSFCV